MTSYTIRPTPFVESDETDDDIVLTWTADFEAKVIAWCRANRMDGAHVFAGGHGPVIGAEGYEDNYCGWIDAR